MAVDILLLDLSGITLIADCFVVASGESERQLRAMSRGLEAEIKSEHGVSPLSVEGSAAGGWILIDYGSVVVHLFSPAQRARYDLEQLWSEARTVVRMA